MRKLALVTVLFTVALAWAGTRAKDSAGAPPTAATDGVSLNEVTSCRASVRTDAGGSLSAGQLILYYYDPVLGWVESDPNLQTLSLGNTFDGGVRGSYVSPDLTVAAAYGRLGVAGKDIKGRDGGSPNGDEGDAGFHVKPIFRVECYGANLP